MSCLIFDGTNDMSVDTCPVGHVPVANRAVIAFTTRTTLYLQTLLVLFNGSIGELTIDASNGFSHYD
jgi:hypothetical protein